MVKSLSVPWVISSCLIFSLICGPKKSGADFVLEPGLGYESIKIKTVYKLNSAESEVSGAGPFVFLRAGCGLRPRWEVGGQFTYATFDDKIDDKFTSLGIYGAYNLNGEVKFLLLMDMTRADRIDADFLGGSWAVEYTGWPVHLGLGLVSRRSRMEHSIVKDQSTFGARFFVSYSRQIIQSSAKDLPKPK